MGSDRPLAHTVFFALKDNSAGPVEELVNACKKYLVDHPGVIDFSVGTLCPELNRPVNQRDFDVGLFILFEDRAAHDAYQISDLHQKFIGENRAKWTSSRVFDCYVDRVTAE